MKKPAKTTTKQYIKLMVLQIGMGLLSMLTVAWIMPDWWPPMVRFVILCWVYLIGYTVGMWLTHDK